MPRVRFEAVLQRPDDEPSGAFIEIPLDVRAVFGRARPPVTVTINGYAYRSTVAVYGGGSFLPVNRQNRAGAGVDVGDRLMIELASDEEERTVEVPADLAAALATEPKLRDRFDRLSFSHRRESVTWIEAARKPETRGRRIAATVSRLRTDSEARP